MMEVVHVAVVVFSLLSLGQSAPVSSCDELLRPIDIQGKEQLLGTWTYIGDTTDLPGSKVLTKMFVETVWWNVTAVDQSNVIVNFQNQKSFGLCFSMSYNATVENNNLVMVHPYSSTAVLINTICPDCIVMYSNYTLGSSTYSGLQLLSRRTKVSAAELAEFKKQVRCLNLPDATILDPEKGFCPDPSVSKETQSMDLSSINIESLSVMEKFLKSEKGIQEIVDIFSQFVGSAAETSKN
ncbi:uncharacterized protein LOC108241515 [Kryptolebias marmoratus]|uniref:uncharacterized protein LOC108241515 n=1 Tax=Kryptolebias marmoratus TaxID=37003 RepID=UPI0007F89470|nr:uncharacterized protein LOC108241515 [Kryptolebias marmoratus]